MSNADANMVSAPWTNPKPRPNTRPPGMSKKNTPVKPVTPVLGARSAAPHATSTPSIATALASSAPSASSESKMPTRSGTSTMNTHGASPAWARFSLPVRPSEQRPGERGDPRGRSRGEQQARPPLEPDLPGGERGHDASAADTSATVSHSAGARILATCGANTGEWQTTSRAGRRRRSRRPRARSARVAVSATSSTSCVASTTAWPAAASSWRMPERRALAA